MSERKTKTGLRKQAPPERSTGSLSLGPKGEPCLVLPTPTSQKSPGKDTLLATARRERAHGDASCQSHPFLGGGNINKKNRLCPRAQPGVPGGAGLGMIPIPSFLLPPPPPSPAALDCCDSRGYDRAVARAKYLLGILEPWISLPRPESSKDKKTNAWGSGLGSHWNCLPCRGDNLPRRVLEDRNR